MKKAVKAKAVRMKIRTCIYSRKLPESIKNMISFDVIQFKNFKAFLERLSLAHDPLLPSMADFTMMGRFPTI